MRGLRRQRGHGTLYLVVTATESLIDSAPRRRPRLLKRLTQCGTRVYLLIPQSLSPVSIAQPMRSGGGSSSYLIINYQLFPKRKQLKNIMTDNLDEPPLADIIMDVRENFIYLRNENLRLQEENNQLKQAIAALQGEPTNPL